MYFHFALKNFMFIIDTRFIRGMRWKLYDDGNLYDLEDDPDEEYPILPTKDNAEQLEARGQLEPIFA
jgi:arylsulfatase A